MAALAFLLVSIRAEGKTVLFPYGGWVWSSNAASCIPDSSSITNNAYELAAGYVHTTTHSPVILYCPVPTLFTNEEEPFTTDNLGEAVYTHILYKGLRDDVNSHSYTRIQLVRMAKNFGNETVITDAYLPSTSSVSSQMYETTMTSYSNWSETNYYYYVKITMQPSPTLNGYDQTVYAVWLGLGSL